MLCITIETSWEVFLNKVIKSVEFFPLYIFLASLIPYLQRMHMAMQDLKQ